MKHLRIVIVLIASLFLIAGASPSAGDYHFGEGSFAKEMWINNKAVFKKPIGVNVEIVTAGAFDWIFADPVGKEVRTLHQENEHGGWTSMNFAL